MKHIALTRILGLNWALVLVPSATPLANAGTLAEKNIDPAGTPFLTLGCSEAAEIAPATGDSSVMEFLKVGGTAPSPEHFLV